MEEEFPYFLLMGMSPEQYWMDDPNLSAGYVQADQLRRQQTSNDFWLMGAYVFQAVSAVANNAMRDRKKGQRPKSYLEEPYRVIPYTKAEEEARAKQERQRVIDFFNRMAAADEKRKQTSKEGIHHGR